jgi:chromosome segregation ATPase
MDSAGDEMLQAAEAELRQAEEEMDKLDAQRDAAVDRLEELENAPFDTPEEEAELNRQLEEADEEVSRLRALADDAEQAWSLAHEQVDDLSGASDDDDDADEDAGEMLSVDDAADIWMSSGMDEDRTFGYTEDELRDALED